MSAMMTLLSAGDAQRLTQRIKLTASSVRDGLFKLRNLVDEAKGSNAWQILGFPSWTAYLADTLGSEPMRLGREERQELVSYLSGEGMSTRAIAPIVGVDKDTVRRDVRRGVFTPPVSNDTGEVIADPITGEIIPDEMVDASDEEFETALLDTRGDRDMSQENVVAHLAPPRQVVGLDGKSYTSPVRRVEPKPVLTGVESAQRNAEDGAKAFGQGLFAMWGLTFEDHRIRLRDEWWPAGLMAVPPTERELANPATFRAIAVALNEMADEWEKN